MKPFGYLRDGLFLASTGAYVVNRWLLKPLLVSPFLHGQFNDLLLIPAALPPVLWLQRRIGLRQDDDAPRWREMLPHLALWALLCEFAGPRWLHRGTADGRDVVAYAIGGVAACLWWNRRTGRIERRAR